MTDRTMRDELNDVKQHAKDAARSTLMAVRTAVDFVLNRLDGEDEKPAGDPADRMTPDEQPPPPPPDV